MYERFYQLRERPFALSPDPEYLYPSRVHKEALSYLRFGIEGHAGFVVITGEIGSGKTTLLQTLLRGLGRETTVARIVNTMLDPYELLQAILIDFGQPADGSKPTLLRRLAEFLVEERSAGRLVLLVVDEAQNLSPESLEEVRMLSNLETEKSKLIQIVLVGQPNLRDALERTDLEQLRQRVTVSYHLTPLDAADTAKYINHRLRRAAAGPPLEFPQDVTALVHRRSGGVPRLINVICDAVLLFGYGAERLEIDADLAREAIAELEDTGVLAAERATVAPGGTRQAAAPDAVREPVAVAAPARAAQASNETVSNRAGRAASVRETSPAPPRREERERERELAARESAIARREQALAEQRRVLAEQYRLLGPSEVHAPAQPSARPATQAAWPPVAYPRPAARPAAADVSPFHAESAARSLWSRVRRVFGAPPATAFDERS